MVNSRIYDILTGMKEIFALILINAMGILVWYLTGETYALMLAFMTDAWVLDKNIDIMKKIAVSYIEGKELSKITLLKELGFSMDEIREILSRVSHKREGETQKAEIKRRLP